MIAPTAGRVTIVGVHSPELPEEHLHANVVRALVSERA